MAYRLKKFIIILRREDLKRHQDDMKFNKERKDDEKW